MIAVGDSVWLGAICAVVIIVAIVLGRNISAKLGSVAVTVDSVNRAVNARKPGQVTISEQVATTAKRVDDIHAAVESLATATNRRIADVDRAIDSIDGRLAAMDVRVSALEVHQTPAA